ncbi:MAG: DUF502 domain-containing protein [Natronomonas sp.]
MAERDRGDGESSRRYRTMRTVVLTGLAIVVPVLVTAYVIWFAVSIVGDVIQPLVGLLELAGVEVLAQFVALLVLFGIVVAVGLLTQYRYGERLVETFDYLIASIPGIGTVYQSIRQVGSMALNSDDREFEGVKLVEMFSEEMYVIAFETTEAPDSVAAALEATGVITLFIPLAPNPVTGGYLTYVPEDRVIDVDMSVEEGIRAVLTSGIAAGDRDRKPERFTMEELQEVTESEALDDVLQSRNR